MECSTRFPQHELATHHPGATAQTGSSPRLQSQPCPHLDAAIAEAFGDAHLQAQKETGFAAAFFPPTCPWTNDQVLSADFLPP
jgi:hypothetical protein